MKLQHPEVVIALGTAALTVGCIAWYFRSKPQVSSSGVAPQPGASPYVPLGYSWNVQAGTFTRLNARGDIEALPVSGFE